MWESYLETEKSCIDTNQNFYRQNIRISLSSHLSISKSMKRITFLLRLVE